MEKPGSGGANENSGQEERVRVTLTGRTPALYPQAARVLRRIVVRLSRARHGTDDALRSGEKAP